MIIRVTGTFEVDYDMEVEANGYEDAEGKALAALMKHYNLTEDGKGMKYRKDGDNFVLFANASLPETH